MASVYAPDGQIVRKTPPVLQGLTEPDYQLYWYFHRFGFLDPSHWERTAEPLVTGAVGKRWDHPRGRNDIVLNTDASVRDSDKEADQPPVLGYGLSSRRANGHCDYIGYQYFNDWDTNIVCEDILYHEIKVMDLAIVQESNEKNNPKYKHNTRVKVYNDNKLAVKLANGYISLSQFWNDYAESEEQYNNVCDALDSLWINSRQLYAINEIQFYWDYRETNFLADFASHFREGSAKTLHIVRTPEFNDTMTHIIHKDWFGPDFFRFKTYLKTWLL